MILKKRNYKSYDALKLAFEASPACVVLYVLLPVTQSVMQTAVTAVATANFLDMAMEILNHTRPYQDIWPALALVLLTLGLVNTLGAASQLAASKVSVSLQRSLKPVIVKTSRLAEGKCALVVTHRIGSARLADRIIVMDAGRIVDMGTHDELTARPGQYARMWEAQAQWYES